MVLSDSKSIFLLNLFPLRKTFVCDFGSTNLHDKSRKSEDLKLFVMLLWKAEYAM